AGTYLSAVAVPVVGSVALRTCGSQRFVRDRHLPRHLGRRSRLWPLRVALARGERAFRAAVPDLSRADAALSRCGRGGTPAVRGVAAPERPALPARARSDEGLRV